MATKTNLKLSLKLGALFVLCTATLMGLFFLLRDRVTPTGCCYPHMPSIWPFFLVAIIISIFTAFAIKRVVAPSLNLPKQVVTFMLAYTLLIVAAKFLLAPYALYGTSMFRELSFFWDAPLIFLFVVPFIYMAYDIMYLNVARASFSKVGTTLGSSKSPEKFRFTLLRRLLIISPIIGLVVFATIAKGSEGFVFSILVPSSIAEYLLAMVLSPFGLLGFLLVHYAGRYMRRSFDSTAEQAVAIRDATLLTLVFWIGLGFLIAYHALWVVFMVGAISIWPLNTASPE